MVLVHILYDVLEWYEYAHTITISQTDQLQWSYLPFSIFINTTICMSFLHLIFYFEMELFIFSTISLYDMNMRILQQVFKQTKYFWVATPFQL